MVLLDADAEARARAVKLLLFDADGVMTDGGLVFAPDGVEWKTFDSKDGLGLRLARESGLLTGVVSGRRSPALERRAQELRFEEIHMGIQDKGRVLDAILARRSLAPAAVAFVGDDLVDIPAMRRSGLAVATLEAGEDVRRFAHAVTQHPGGRGALRETVEFILGAQGRWQAIVDRFATS